MKRPLLVILAIIVAAPLAQGGAPVDETRFALREEFLRLINRDRTQFGLQPLQLDPFASSVADDYCRAQIRNGTSGHFTIDGEAPYMRYSFAGGNDGLSENAAAWSANYGFSDRALYEMIRRSEDAMMREVAPNDGHRHAILDPFATHVGIGLAWDRGEFRLTQEFIRHYLDWTRQLPRSASINDHVLCSGYPLHGYDVDAITVHHEPLPQTMAAVTANAIDSYSLPESRRQYSPRLRVGQFYTDGTRGDFAVAKDGKFAFVVPFVDGPGVYTVVVWVRPHGSRQLIAASNVSIRVTGEPAGASTIAASR
ncbi:MAG TPA: CAP domain-containing protein [Thermoanaerobaculia bacterium]